MKWLGWVIPYLFGAGGGGIPSPNPVMAPPPKEAPVPALPPSITVLPVPLITYDSDNKLGFGAVGAFYYDDHRVEPYRLGLVLQLLETTVGVADDYLNVDLVHPFDLPVRFTGEFRYRREPNASWFGAGNTTPRLTSAPSAYNLFSQETPAARLTVQHPLGTHWSTLFAYLFEYSVISPYPGSLLEMTKPTGIGGGRNASLLLGFAYDSRDNEAWPTRGQFLEISARSSNEWTGSNFNWVGGTAIARMFFLLPGNVVLAERLLIDVMDGNVPFYDLNATGSLQEVDGLGGVNSMRGFVKDRFVGLGKVLENVEVRRLFNSVTILNTHIDFGGVLFGDVGRVYGQTFHDGPPLLVHGDLGVGVRAMMNRELVLRLDVALSNEGPRFFAVFRNLF